MTDSNHLHSELSNENENGSLSIAMNIAANLLVDWLAEADRNFMSTVHPKPHEKGEGKLYDKRNTRR